jgi:hypothetical protein
MDFKTKRTVSLFPSKVAKKSHKLPLKPTKMVKIQFQRAAF